MIMKKCSNCKYKLKAKNELVVGCKILNSLTRNFEQQHNKRCPICNTDINIKLFDVTKGNIYEGWFYTGSMLSRGIVIDKEGLCKNHQYKNSD